MASTPSRLPTSKSKELLEDTYIPNYDKSDPIASVVWSVMRLSETRTNAVWCNACGTWFKKKDDTLEGLRKHCNKLHYTSPDGSLLSRRKVPPKSATPKTQPKKKRLSSAMVGRRPNPVPNVAKKLRMDVDTDAKMDVPPPSSTAPVPSSANDLKPSTSSASAPIPTSPAPAPARPSAIVAPKPSPISVPPHPPAPIRNPSAPARPSAIAPPNKAVTSAPARPSAIAPPRKTVTPAPARPSAIAPPRKAVPPAISPPKMKKVSAPSPSLVASTNVTNATIEQPKTVSARPATAPARRAAPPPFAPPRKAAPPKNNDNSSGNTTPVLQRPAAQPPRTQPTSTPAVLTRAAPLPPTLPAATPAVVTPAVTPPPVLPTSKPAAPPPPVLPTPKPTVLTPMHDSNQNLPISTATGAEETSPLTKTPESARETPVAPTEATTSKAPKAAPGGSTQGATKRRKKKRKMERPPVTEEEWATKNSKKKVVEREYFFGRIPEGVKVIAERWQSHIFASTRLYFTYMIYDAPATPDAALAVMRGAIPDESVEDKSKTARTEKMYLMAWANTQFFRAEMAQLGYKFENAKISFMKPADYEAGKKPPKVEEWLVLAVDYKPKKRKNERKSDGGPKKKKKKKNAKVEEVGTANAASGEGSAQERPRSESRMENPTAAMDIPYTSPEAPAQSQNAAPGTSPSGEGEKNESLSDFIDLTI